MCLPATWFFPLQFLQNTKAKVIMHEVPHYVFLTFFNFFANKLSPVMFSSCYCHCHNNRSCGGSIHHPSRLLPLDFQFTNAEFYFTILKIVRRTENVISWHKVRFILLYMFHSDKWVQLCESYFRVTRM